MHVVVMLNATEWYLDGAGMPHGLGGRVLEGFGRFDDGVLIGGGRGDLNYTCECVMVMRKHRKRTLACVHPHIQHPQAQHVHPHTHTHTRTHTHTHTHQDVLSQSSVVLHV